MGNTLTGTTIAAGYDSLLKTTDNGPITSTLKTITDGLGNDSQLQLSTSKTKANGAFEADSVSYDDGTNTIVVICAQIGDWDMDTTASINYAHGIASAIGKIRRVSCTIRDDAGSVERDLTNANSSGVVNGAIEWNVTNVVLSRTAGGTFDAATYNSTSYNRGFITIEYVSNGTY